MWLGQKLYFPYMVENSGMLDQKLKIFWYKLQMPQTGAWSFF